MKKFSITLILSLIAISIIAQKGKWKKTQELNTREGYNVFAEKYPKSDYYQATMDSILEIDYRATLNQNTINGYNHFLNKYPDSKHVAVIEKNISKIEWTIFCTLKTIQDYNGFMDSYPQSQYKSAARDSIAGIEFRKTLEQNSIQGFNDFLETYYYSDYIAQAKLLLLQLQADSAWKEVQVLNTVPAFREFLEFYPNSNYTVEAQKKLDLLLPEYDWQVARYEEKSIKGYEEFMVKYPESIHVIEARAILFSYFLIEALDELDFGQVAEILEQIESNAMLNTALVVVVRASFKKTFSRTYSSNITAAGVKLSNPETSWEGYPQETLDKFKGIALGLLNKGADPNSVFIVGYEPPGFKELPLANGGVAKIQSNGSKGYIMEASKLEDKTNAKTILDIATLEKSQDFIKLLKRFGAR